MSNMVATNPSKYLITRKMIANGHKWICSKYKTHTRSWTLRMKIILIIILYWLSIEIIFWFIWTKNDYWNYFDQIFYFYSMNTRKYTITYVACIYDSIYFVLDSNSIKYCY